MLTNPIRIRTQAASMATRRDVFGGRVIRGYAFDASIRPPRGHGRVGDDPPNSDETTSLRLCITVP